jgi:hypothetical protein
LKHGVEKSSGWLAASVEPKLTRTLAVIRRRGVTLSPAAQEFLAMLRRRWGQGRRNRN